MKRFLRQGDHYIDAGANIGIYTLLAAKLVGETGQVVAFEPDLKAFSRLSGNVRDNGLTNVVTLRQAALAGAKGTAEFTAGIDTGNSLACLAPTAARKQTVELTTLDSELGGDTYTMCKMDLEGAEFFALAGSTALLRAGNPPVWQMEITDRTLSRGGSSVSQVLAFLNRLDYDLWSYDRQANELRRWASAVRRRGQVGDALAIHRSSLEFAQRRLRET